MIKVRVESNMIKIDGHADYAPSGYDIICAMVSCLTWAFVDTCECIHDVGPGFADISFEGCESELNMFLIGIRGVANQFPDYIELSEHL